MFEVAFYNAVPIFFMLSGATLLGYHQKYDTRTFFKKRFKKAFLPFLVFSILFYAFAIVFTRHPDLSLTKVGYHIATGHIPFTDYWFFVPLFILYLFMPFLSVMVTNLTNRQLLALIVLIVAIQGICEPAIALVGAEWKLPMGSYVAYLLLGYYLSKTDWEKNLKVVVALAAAGILFMSLRYVGIFLSDHRISQLWTYLSLYGFTASAAIFLIVKRLCPIGGGNHTVLIQTQLWCLFDSTLCYKHHGLLPDPNRQPFACGSIPCCLLGMCHGSIYSSTIPLDEVAGTLDIRNEEFCNLGSADKSSRGYLSSNKYVSCAVLQSKIYRTQEPHE